MMKIAFIDLDGTLLRSDGTISPQDISLLDAMGKAGMVRVFATGRNLYSLRRAVSPDVPVDFLLFSSGAGIWDCAADNLIYQKHLDAELMHRVSRDLLERGLSFMVHDTVPENHHFTWYGTPRGDVLRRVNLYIPYARKGGMQVIPQQCSQILAILHPSQLPLLEDIAATFPEVSVIRATSPLDGFSVWMEVFPAGVSKGDTAAWLCRHLGIRRSETVSVGNDFNDVEMLRWTERSFVVANAPAELQDAYETTASNENSGVSVALRPLLEKVLSR